MKTLDRLSKLELKANPEHLNFINGFDLTQEQMKALDQDKPKNQKLIFFVKAEKNQQNH